MERNELIKAEILIACERRRLLRILFHKSRIRSLFSKAKILTDIPDFVLLYWSVMETEKMTLLILKVPINPKLLFCLNKYMCNSEQNGAKSFDFGQNRNFL